MDANLVDRLNARTVETLPADWKAGLKCPRCGGSADRPNCLLGVGDACPRHDPNNYIPDPHIVKPDPLCAEAAATLSHLTEEVGRLRAKLAEEEADGLVWFDAAGKLSDENAALAAAAQKATARAEVAEREVETLRSTLVSVGIAAGALFSPKASVDALTGIPEHVRCLGSSLRTRAEAAEARVKELEGARPSDDLAARCLEILDWHSTGTLNGRALSSFAEAQGLNRTYGDAALRKAEDITAGQAMAYVVRSTLSHKEG